MTEMANDIVKAEVDTENRRIVRKGELGANTSGGSSGSTSGTWRVKGQGHIIGEHRKVLAERINEAYGNERSSLKPEEKAFLDRAAKQFGSRLSSEE